jgi:hypothetical protein
MLSCEGHAWLTQAALTVMQYLPLRKPYWQYIPALNAARRWLHWPAVKHAQTMEVLPLLSPVTR